MIWPQYAITPRGLQEPIWDSAALIAEAESIVHREAMRVAGTFWDATGRRVSAEDVMPSTR